MPQSQQNTNAYHIRNAETVIKTFVNSELNDIQTFTEEGEPILEVDGEPLTRKHVDEALIHLTQEDPNKDTEKDYYIATVERRIGEVEITQRRPLAVTTDGDPLAALTDYYEDFWGADTEESPYHNNAYQRGFGEEIVKIVNVRQVTGDEYGTLTEYLTEIPNIPENV